MDHWIVLVLGFLGFVAMSFIVVWLHSTLLGAFEKQMSSERHEDFRLHTVQVELKLKQHDELMGVLVTQDRILCQIDNGVKDIQSRLRS